MNALQKIVAKAFNLQGGSNPSGVTDWADVPKSYPWDWWQRDIPIEDTYSNTTVEACVATISQTVSMLPIQHRRSMPGGGTEILTNSSAYRVMRKPNPFQTKSAFMVDFVRAMLLKGEGFGVVTRNKRFEIDALYPQRHMSPYVSIDNKDVYYSVADETLINLDMMVAGRDVLHVCMHTNDHPLRGVTPLQAAKLSAATGTSIQGHENRFFTNMSRPSGVLTTDMTLTKDQTQELRKRFNEQAQELATGGMPILTSGLKFDTITMSAVDSEIIETYKMTKEDIASVYRVPLALLGIMDKASFANVEQLMRFWITSGLGYILELIEGALDELFNLPPNEHINFDTEFLLESDFKSRMDGLKTAVQGGIMTPNEARKKEGLADKGEGSDQLLVQMQMVPVDLTGEKLEAEIDQTKKTTEQIGKEPPAPADPPLEPVKEDEEVVTPEKAVAVHKTLTDIKAV